MEKLSEVNNDVPIQFASTAAAAADDDITTIITLT